jgi:hypothetical protein
VATSGRKTSGGEESEANENLDEEREPEKPFQVTQKIEGKFYCFYRKKKLKKKILMMLLMIK